MSGERSARQEAYGLASETVRLLNKAIDEATDLEKRAHLKVALVEAHGMEDALAEALKAESKS